MTALVRVRDWDRWRAEVDPALRERLMLEGEADASGLTYCAGAGFGLSFWLPALFAVPLAVDPDYDGDAPAFPPPVHDPSLGYLLIVLERSEDLASALVELPEPLFLMIGRATAEGVGALRYPRVRAAACEELERRVRASAGLLH